MRRTAVVCAGVFLCGLAVMPLDRRVADWAAGLRHSGDLWRELETYQQYGQGGSIVLACVVIWLLDPARRRRLLDWGVAATLVWMVVFPAKILIGRPRPRLGDPYGFLWPWGTWNYGGQVGLRHAWQVGQGISSDLWSMPSSHAAFAAVMSVFLTRLYPRLTGLAVAMVVVVGLGRVLFRAHFPSDVLIGGAVAWFVASMAVGGFWGVRGADWIRVRFLDRGAAPHWPGVVAEERRRVAGRGG